MQTEKSFEQENLLSSILSPLVEKTSFKQAIKTEKIAD